MNRHTIPSPWLKPQRLIVPLDTLVIFILISLMPPGCSVPASDNSPAELIAASYRNPQPVAIRGYDGDAMEPFITRDGAYLFFNNRNDPSVDTNLHWARRVDDLTFSYLGEIGGVNSGALDAVASMDERGNFFFVSTRDYARTLSLLFSCRFRGGSVSGIVPVAGIARRVLGAANFDAEISADGATLYYVDGRIVPGRGLPEAADILFARRSGDGFVPDPDALAVMANVNTSALEYAPATSSDGLTLFFTRLHRLAGRVPVSVGIYVATRVRAGEPFGIPARIEEAAGFVEAPTVAPDGSLYYHKKVSGRFVIYRLGRTPAGKER
jgi:hypothetical protein